MKLGFLRPLFQQLALHHDKTPFLCFSESTAGSSIDMCLLRVPRVSECLDVSQFRAGCFGALQPLRALNAVRPQLLYLGACTSRQTLTLAADSRTVCRLHKDKHKEQVRPDRRSADVVAAMLLFFPFALRESHITTRECCSPRGFERVIQSLSSISPLFPGLGGHQHQLLPPPALYRPSLLKAFM